MEAGDDLFGDDGEGSVDGSHPNDLGFMRQAEAFAKVLGPLLPATMGQIGRRTGLVLPGGLVAAKNRLK